MGRDGAKAAKQPRRKAAAKKKTSAKRPEKQSPGRNGAATPKLRVSKKVYRELSGRQARVLIDQSRTHGVPVDGRTVDLAAVVRWLHDFLADKQYILTRGADDIDRKLRIQELEIEKRQIDLAERRRELVNVDEAAAAMARISDRLRQLGSQLTKNHGAGAGRLLDTALVEIEERVEELFEEPHETPAKGANGSTSGNLFE